MSFCRYEPPRLKRLGEGGSQFCRFSGAREPLGRLGGLSQPEDDEESSLRLNETDKGPDCSSDPLGCMAWELAALLGSSVALLFLESPNLLLNLLLVVLKSFDRRQAAQHARV